MRATRSSSLTEARTRADDLLQHDVADGVAAGVVDLLEAVEVAEQHRRLAARPTTVGADGVEALEDLVAVQQSGELVVPGPVAELLLGLDLGVDQAHRERRAVADAVGVDEGPGLELEPVHLPVGGRQVEAEGLVHHPGVHLEGPFELGADLGPHDVEDPQPDPLGRVPAEHAVEVRRGPHDHAVALEDHPVGDVVDQQAIAPFALTQLVEGLDLAE